MGRSLFRDPGDVTMGRRSAPEFACVVVSFDSATHVDALLRSLEESTASPSVVVVVENGPHALTIQAGNLAVETIHRPENPGYGTAVNLGVRSIPAHIRWVIVMNADVTVESDTLEVLLRAAQTHPRAGSLGPTLLNPDGSVYPSARAIPRLGIGIGHALLGAVWPTNPWTRRYRGTYDSQKNREVGWLSGACLLVRREAFDEVGGFDPGYFMFMEDVDLGLRLSQAGWTNLYVPEAHALHEVGHATGAVKSDMTLAHHNSAKRFVARLYPGARYAGVRVIVNTGLTLRAWAVGALRRAKG